MTGAMHTESWETIDWASAQRNVFRLQKRIYRASVNQNYRQVHNLQRLLLRSNAARLLAVRQVTQDNRGKNTAGVDGVANLPPQKRLALVCDMDLRRKPTSIRRVYIPKHDGTQRPLGIPTIRDRAHQALVKLALEPEWEAKFEANSYGFRPGRSAHDAVVAIFNAVRYKSKYVLDADIEKCFDRINHQALLAKLNTFSPLKRLLRRWLEASILDGGKTTFPSEGTPQGGVISPLLANIALHGIESVVTTEQTVNGNILLGKNSPRLVRYADDFVVIHEDEQTIRACQLAIERFLEPLGLRLKPSKTQIVHTLNLEKSRPPGFDFLGFTIRQYQVGQFKTARNGAGQPLGFKTLITPTKVAAKRHYEQLRRLVKAYVNTPTEALAAKLNPVIRGWSSYYATCVCTHSFNRLDALLWRCLYNRMRLRNDRRDGARKVYKLCMALFHDKLLRRHTDTKKQRYAKVKGARSPFDGDWVYWATRLGRHPELSNWKASSLKAQKGRCIHCRLPFAPGDILETHHRDGNHDNNTFSNRALLHGHCHDAVHRCAYDKG